MTTDDAPQAGEESIDPSAGDRETDEPEQCKPIDGWSETAEAYA